MRYYESFAEEHPVSNFLFWSCSGIIILLASFFTYTLIFEIEIITSAQGKTVPEGRIKTIQSIVEGKVSKLYIKDGDLVQANADLVELDSTQSIHDINVLNEELKLIERKISRLEVLISLFQDNDLSNSIEIDTIRDKDIGLYNELFSINEQILEFRRSIESNILELQIINSQIESNESNIKYTNHKIEVTKKLLNTSMPKASLFDIQNKLNNMIHDRKKYRYSYEVKQKNIEVLNGGLSKLRSDLLFKSHYELDRLYKDQDSTKENIKKAQHKVKNMTIKSPIEGYVENLKISTIGGVINSGETLMNVVPLDAKIKLEANVHSKDIGFIKLEQKVAIKLDAFPYIQYGTIQGNVCNIARDSFTSNNTDYYYRVDICLKKNYIEIKKTKHFIDSGYTAQVDICTDHRKIIDFFLGPIKTAISNSFKER